MEQITYQQLTEAAKSIPLHGEVPTSPCPFADDVTYAQEKEVYERKTRSLERKFPSHTHLGSIFMRPEFIMTPFPQIIGLSGKTKSYQLNTVLSTIEHLITPLGGGSRIRVGAAAHLFLLDQRPTDYHTLVGVCAQGKLLTNHIVPIGEKIKQFDNVTGINIDDPTDRLMYHFLDPLRPSVIGAIFRGITEEIPDLHYELKNQFRAGLKRSAVIRYIFFDSTYIHINFPVIARFDHSLLSLITTKTSMEWARPLEWVPLQTLCDESYQGHPIPPGIRYVAGEIVKELHDP